MKNTILYPLIAGIALVIVLVFWFATSRNSIFSEGNGYIWFEGKGSGLILNSNIVDLEEGTISFWIKVDQIDNRPQVLLLSSSNPASDGFGETLPQHDFSVGIIGAENPRAPRQLEWTFQTETGGAALRSGEPFPIGDWHHIAVIWENRGERLQLLLDGEIIAEEQISYSPTTFPQLPLLEKTYIGTPFISGSNKSLLGGIDELRVWNHAQSSFEITWSMKREIDPASSGLVAYWRFNNKENYMYTEEVNRIIQAKPVKNPLWVPSKNN